MTFNSQLSDGPNWRSVGAPVSRIDGRLKVTGAAVYAAEHDLPRLAHAVVVPSTIAAGRIAHIDAAEAEAMPGVRLVLTHRNAPRLAPATRYPEGGVGQSLLPLQDDNVRFNGQAIALVVAETLEQASEAARHIRVAYDAASAVPSLESAGARSFPAADVGFGAFGASWGDAAAAFAAAPVRIDGTYTTPREYHCAMEPHATCARWDGDRLTVYEPSQWVEGARDGFAAWFGLDREQVQIVSPHVGGGFGSKAPIHPHAALPAMAARVLGRPVKLVLTRPQVFASVGNRPATRQRVRLGAQSDGRLTALTYRGENETSLYDNYIEPGGLVAKLFYAVPNLSVDHHLVPVNTVTPTWMRAPAEAVGTFAMESAMDELAHALGIDPIDLRLRNYAEHDPENRKPWSSKALREAFAEGARRFGWERRAPAPGTTRDAHGQLIGWGVATATYPVYRMPAEARVRVTANGGVEVESGGSDIGTGTYTIVAQVAADALGVSPERVTVRLGDTRYPGAPNAGGSKLAGALTPVVHEAAVAVREMLITLARDTADSPLQDANDIVVDDGRVMPARKPEYALAFAEILRRAGRESIEALRDSFPAGLSDAQKKTAFSGDTPMLAPGDHSMHSWGAQFVEVRVDPDLGTIRVTRMLGVFDCGRVLNPRTARSQLIGGMTMGLGMALLEGAQADLRNGRVIHASFADYVVPVNADVPDIEVAFVGEPDPYTNALGTKAVGELGITGVAAAIGNAVFHATGRRFRDLPIRLEHVIG